MELIDTHCHLNHPDYQDDLDDVVTRAIENNVRRLLVIGYDLDSSRRSVELSNLHDGVYSVIGIHPESGDEWNAQTKSEFTQLYHTSKRIAAYGEIGLDYHWESIPRQDQQRIFAEQIDFAGELSHNGLPLPIVVHCREAEGDVVKVLEESQTKLPIIIHCFTGDIDTARTYINHGYYLGIGGVATFKKADALREAIAYIPIDRMILETDCPYLAPQKWRGKRNEPAYITETARIIAETKSLDIEKVASATTNNAVRLFHL